MKKKGYFVKVAMFLLAVAPVLSRGCLGWFGEPQLPANYKK